LAWLKSDAFALLNWDTPGLPIISELTESVGQVGMVRWPLNTRCQKGTRLEGADDPGEFDGRRGNFGLDEGETTTAPAVEDVAGAYFSKLALHFMQILLYKDATSNSQNTIIAYAENRIRT